jgi:dihydrophenazinedicarboxylate synthase
VNAAKFESLTAKLEVDFVEYHDPPPEPMTLLCRWLTVAAEQGVREPRALALATADASGRASNRIVVFTGITDNGMIFSTHSTSQKGREIAETGWASGLLYWRETGQQVIVSGAVTQLPDAESDKLWYSRPTPLHAMSVVSHQSDPIDDEAVLRAAAARFEALGTALPRPGRFAGYRLEPAVVEFWCARPDRFHQRLRYRRATSADRWTITRLQP